jgi:NAD(P)-dependent dehydrogenase (short-subunit alcohol dehydrogenase family)
MNVSGISDQRDLEGLSALVAGATSGIGRAAAEELSRHGFDRLFAANVRAAYFLVAALGPKMAARGSGSIISTGSMAGLIGLAGGAAYGATKATLAAMTRSWAAEFSPSGVRVNAIAAGPVLTNGAAPDRIEALGATTLLARPAQPGPPSPARSPA